MPIKVLVIDDCARNRKGLSALLGSMPGVGPVETAIDGVDGLRQLERFRPDVVMLDLEMPNMDGFEFLRIAKGRQNVPVIVLTGRTWESSGRKAIALGATDFLERPVELDSAVRDEISKRLRTLPFKRHDSHLRRLPAGEIVCIGASTGGPKAVAEVIGALPPDFPAAVAVAIHMPQWLTVPFTERLCATTGLKVTIAKDGSLIEEKTVYVAPGGSDLTFSRSAGSVYAVVSKAAGTDPFGPSIDKLLSSASVAWGGGLTAVILTGMGDDGTEGVREVKKRGGFVIAEARESAVVFGMPGSAAATGLVDSVQEVKKIGEYIGRRLKGSSLKLA